MDGFEHAIGGDRHAFQPGNSVKQFAGFLVCQVVCVLNLQFRDSISQAGVAPPQHHTDQEVERDQSSNEHQQPNDNGRIPCGGCDHGRNPAPAQAVQ